MSKKLLKSTAIVSVMTFISRISGLVRDVVMASLIGTSALADAFFVAFRIPNFLRRIFGEGAFSQAFVPVFSELHANNSAQSKQFVSAAAGALGLITLVLTLLGIVFAPYVVSAFAPGFSDDAVKFDTTVSALRIMFPYLFFISLVAMSAGVLNTLNRFAVPAATPVLLNICLILAMWLLIPYMSNAAYALAIGVLVAGFVQLLFQLPSLRKEGVLALPRLDRNNPAVRKVFRLMLPAMFSVSVAQINTLVNTFLASFLVTGSVSWLYYSDRLMEFPVGVFGIALATVVLPSLSREYASGTAKSYSEMLDWSLRWVVMIALPASVALFLLAESLLTTMFQYRAFSAEDVRMSATALQAFSIGVCGFIFVKVLAPGFFARQDTTTPMRIAVISVLANIVLSIILVRYLQHTGLALAISIAAWINASLLCLVLLRKGIYQFQPGWLFYLARVLVAVCVMAMVLMALLSPTEDWLAMTVFERIGKMVILVSAGAGSYFLVLLICGIRPQHLLLKPQ